MFKQFFLFAGLMFFIAACGNQGGEQSDDMSQFAEDSSFQEAHPTPDEVDFQPRGEMIEFDTPDGKTASAYALMSEEPSQDYILVIHEWWGLNDQIKMESERLFDSLMNVNVLALDMYDGKVTDDQEKAGEYMQAMSEDRGKAIINGALAYAGEDADIGTIGWCFGGGWSLRASIMAGDRGEACVMYYGMPVQEAQALAPLEAPILGIFAEQDGWITPEVANDFEDLAEATGKEITIHQFDADHAFANPSNPAYDREATQKARELTLAFFREHLK